MKTSYLEYYKLILDKVSFDPQLVTKEYQKARTTLAPHEVPQLNAWLRAKGILPQPVRRKVNQPAQNAS